MTKYFFFGVLFGFIIARIVGTFTTNRILSFVCTVSITTLLMWFLNYEGIL
jgi:hypothetical protein